MSASNPQISRAAFGTLPGGETVEIFTLRNCNGMEASILNYGGIVTTLKTPDRNGGFTDVVLGCDTFEPYLNNGPYFGAIIGRYGNRIAKGKFTLDGQLYSLTVNNGPNHLHGGLKGFDKVLWKASPSQTPAGPALKLEYLSPDGEEGYPGNLAVTAIYTLTETNALQLYFTATTDKKTLCNLTHHSYFNLAGHASGDVLDHIVQINANSFTPVDANLIPTGELRSVICSPMDFLKPHRIGDRIDAADEQLQRGYGYDHNWVLNKKPGELALAVIVHEPRSGRVMEVWATAPGTQLYTGNFVDASMPGKGGAVYRRRSGLCFEPQFFPDTPNKPEFPSAVLNPAEIWCHTIVYKFSVAQS